MQQRVKKKNVSLITSNNVKSWHNIIGSTAILKDNNWKQSILPNILFPLIDINEMGNFCRISLIIPTDHFNGVLDQNPYTLYSMFDCILIYL